MATSFREAEYAGWTARAESYDTLFTTISNQAIPHILSVLGDLSSKAVLDVCCGPGHLAAAAVQCGAFAEGIDFAPTMIARATRNYPTIPFHVGDAESLPYGNGSFDHVVCAFGIMHLQQPEAAIAEAHRVLRPSGIYAFTQWALNDDLLRIVSAAIAEHGRSDLDIPQAPPPMRFSDPDECRRVLRIYGFREIRIEQITLQWRTDRAEALLELIYSSAVRAALLLEAPGAGTTGLHSQGHHRCCDSTKRRARRPHTPPGDAGIRDKAIRLLKNLQSEQRCLDANNTFACFITEWGRAVAQHGRANGSRAWPAASWNSDGSSLLGLRNSHHRIYGTRENPPEGPHQRADRNISLGSERRLISVHNDVGTNPMLL